MRAIREKLKEWTSAPLWSAGVAEPCRPPSQTKAPAGMHLAALAFAAGLSLCAQSVYMSDHPIKQTARSAQSQDEAPGKDAVWALSHTARHGETRLAPLPVNLPKGAHWSDQRLALELIKKEPFMAMAIVIERLPLSGYMDSGGANIGAGYCVTRRLKDHGERVVRSDLTRAGFGPEQIEALISQKPARVEATRATQEQGLRLLSLMKQQYQSSAIRAIGEEVWSKLPENKRGALTYLSYNTGDVGRFKKLIYAARKGNDIEALRQMSVAWTDQRGRDRKNHRLRAWAQAAWASPLALFEAVSHPMLFELSFAGAQGQESFINAALTRPRKGAKTAPAPMELNLAENLNQRRQEQERLAKLEEMKKLSVAKATRLARALKSSRGKARQEDGKERLAMDRKTLKAHGKSRV